MRVVLILGLLFSNLLYAKETRIIIDVEDTQKERKELRWTLTEWLRIKERMKMMDVWLAMNSNPAKDKFSPELQFAYWQTRGDYQIDIGVNNVTDEFMTAKDVGNNGRIQLYLTNIVTASTGWKVPNIDFGIEALYINHGFSDREFTTPTQPLQEAEGSVKDPYTMSGYANFRILGTSIQDTSLVLKFGYYNGKRPVDTPQPISLDTEGLTYAAEFIFYLFNFIGLEGTYNRWGTSDSFDGNQEQRGSRYDYGAFLELWLLRVSAGYYKEWWTFSEVSNDTGQRAKLDTQVDGVQFGVKLSF